MLTKRENFWETIHDGTPDRFVKQYEALSFFMTHHLISGFRV